MSDKTVEERSRLFPREKLLADVEFREAPDVVERLDRVCRQMRPGAKSRLAYRIGVVVLEVLDEEGLL